MFKSGKLKNFLDNLMPIDLDIGSNEVKTLEKTEDFRLSFEEFLSENKNKPKSSKSSYKPKYKFKDYVCYAIYYPAVNRVKLGMTDNIERRMSDAFTFAPCDIELIGVRKFQLDKKQCESFETWMHKYLSSSRCTINTGFKINENEFFEYDDNVKDFLNRYYEDYEFEVPLEDM